MFNDDDKVVNDTQSAAVEQDKEMMMDGVEEDNIEDLGDEHDAELSGETQEVAEPDGKAVQSPEENKIYAKLRRKAEEEAKAKYEGERKALEEQRLLLQQHEAEQKVMAAITPQKIWDYANENGISEDMAAKFLTLEAKSQIDGEKQKVREQYIARQKEKTALSDEPYFAELEKKIDKFLDDNPTWDMTNAYNYLLGQNVKDLMSNAKTSTEKRTLANIQDRSRRRVVDDSDGAINQGTSTLTDKGRKAALFMGVDPREIAKHVKQRMKELGR